MNKVKTNINLRLYKWITLTWHGGKGEAAPQSKVIRLQFSLHSSPCTYRLWIITKRQECIQLMETTCRRPGTCWREYIFQLAWLGAHWHPQGGTRGTSFAYLLATASLTHIKESGHKWLEKIPFYSPAFELSKDVLCISTNHIYLYRFPIIYFTVVIYYTHHFFKCHIVFSQQSPLSIIGEITWLHHEVEYMQQPEQIWNAEEQYDKSWIFWLISYYVKDLNRLYVWENQPREAKYYRPQYIFKD